MSLDGRVKRGVAKANSPVTIIDREGKTRTGKIGQVLGYLGLRRGPDVAINTPPIASKRHTITNGLLNFNTTP